MKKKILLIILILLTLVAAGSFAIGIGAAGIAAGGSADGYYGGLVTIDTEILIFNVEVFVGSDGIHMGVSPVYRVLNDNLSGIVNWNLGFGPYVNLLMSDFDIYSCGVKIPVGLSMFFVDSVELFLEAAPFTGYDMLNEGFDWGVQAAYGLRFWF